LKTNRWSIILAETCQLRRNDKSLQKTIPGLSQEFLDCFHPFSIVNETVPRQVQAFQTSSHQNGFQDP